jgi:DNA (cytosine-5)-methyltransferase 1
MVRDSKKLTAIDLFSGAGGLTLGLKKAGFNVVVGVEKNPKIADTFIKNHPKTNLLIRDIKEITGEEILIYSKVDKINLIAGCPPCQGFSDLTSKYRRDDTRNNLILEMLRIIVEIKPDLVMLENVPGLANRGKSLLQKFTDVLESNGYIINYDVLQMADYGIPQSRKRLVLLGGKGFFIPFPSVTCSKSNDSNGLKPWLTLKDVIGNYKSPFTLSEAKCEGGPRKFNWHVVSDLKEISIERLKNLVPGNNRSALPVELRPYCHSDSNKGFINVYGRLSWDMTSPTITTGFNKTCTGRFGHPDELRTISVREAASIQTFPLSYSFETDSIGLACDLVGNAFPPEFGYELALVCMQTYKKFVIRKERI